MRSKVKERSITQKQTHNMMRGTGFTFLTFFSRKFVTFVSTMILVRFLSPDEFGLVAAALLVLRYFDAINDAGVGAALVQTRSNPEYTARVAMLISLSIGMILSVATAASAPFLAAFFKQPALTSILLFLSPIFLVGSLSRVQSFWLRKTFRFSARVIPEVGSVLVKAIISITLAILGFGAWSLVIGHFTGQIASTVAYFVASDLPLRPVFDKEVARRLFALGSKLSIITFVGIFSNSLDQLVIGRHLGEAALGYFVLGAALPELTILGISTSASQVFFPMFSRIQNSPRLLRHAYLLSLKYVVILTAPLAIGMAVVAEDFVRVAYSQKWLASVPIIQILALNALIKSMSFNAGDVFKAKAQTGRLTLLILLQIAVALPILIVIVSKGIVAVATTILCVSSFITAATTFVAIRQLRVPLKSLFNAISPGIIASVLMCMCCLGIEHLLVDAIAPVRLSLTICIGIASYSLSIWYLDRHACETILATVRR